MNLFTKTLLSITLFSFVFISCKPAVESKESYLKEYKAFVEEIKKDKDNYTPEEWNEKDVEFKKFSNELYSKYESELGFLEQARIAKYAITYGATRGVNALNSVLEDEEIEDSLEELKKLWDDDLKEELESVITEVKKVWDEDLKDDLEDELNELKVVLEDEEFQEKIKKKVEEVQKIVEDKELEGDFKEVMTHLEKILKSIEEKVEE